MSGGACAVVRVARVACYRANAFVSRAQATGPREELHGQACWQQQENGQAPSAHEGSRRFGRHRSLRGDGVFAALGKNLFDFRVRAGDDVH
jgi:hypothetical protein